MRLLSSLRGWAGWLSGHGEIGLALVLSLAAAALWAFVALAEEVREGATRGFDTAVLMALRAPGDPADPLGPVWVEELARDATALGGTGVLTFSILAAAGFLWLLPRRATAFYLLAATVSGVALSNTAKALFDRPRPDLVPHGTAVYTASFPSGHALMAAVTWLTLAVLLATTFRRRRLKVYVVGLAVLVTIAVGASRVYLGVHWPTDVLAGWAAGGAWALACAALARVLSRRGALEAAEDDG
mgnify:CR=1 FL=1